MNASTRAAAKDRSVPTRSWARARCSLALSFWPRCHQIRESEISAAVAYLAGNRSDVIEAVAAGARIIQYRAKALPARELFEEAKALRPLAGDFASASLPAVVTEALEACSPLAARARVTLAMDHAHAPLEIRMDRPRLRQVFQNLVQNAFKYGDKGGVVRIEAKHIPSLGRQAGRYAIAVMDKGPGIAPEHLPRLTERFYRVDVASSREKGGTGLGLAIVKHILNRHRGELAIASTPGKGSTFTVMLSEVKNALPERGAAAE